MRRVLDVNDRSLRSIVVGLGPKSNGITQESGFDITPASEIMAILCLSKDVSDLRRRIENILLGFTYDDQPFTVKDLGVAGAITVLLKDAIHPNLVQTTEGTAAFVHGGPFANIAHGCNSILATKLAMSFGDYVITEAGFGADLGAEKFYNIKCRKSGLQPRLTVIVATAQGLKMHGGVSLDRIKEPNMEGLKEGLRNLDKHVRNLRSFGQTIIVAFNNTVMAPATPKSFTVKGWSSYVKPNRMFSIRRRRSLTSLERQRIAIISEAGVISKPDSWVIPLDLGPRPTTMLRNERSFTSSTLRQRISFNPKPFAWF